MNRILGDSEAEGLDGSDEVLLKLKLYRSGNAVETDGVAIRGCLAARPRRMP
jgi:hypothetical protein